MSSRDKILNNINANKLSVVELPVIDMSTVNSYADAVTQFKSTLESIGGRVVMLDDLQQLKTIIGAEKQAGKNIINTLHELGAIDEALSSLSAHDLALIDKAYIKGSLAVAENGAVWLPEPHMINRLLPFICENLAIVIQKGSIVNTMHHAYQRIEAFSSGFGVFIAGPSKTADIEQSLVIGAHGARSMTVYLVE